MVNCILSQGDGVAAVHCWNGGAAILDCNNFFTNVADYEGCDPGVNDFYSDPVFCDPAFGDFTVDCLSPCIGHPVCGQVGALGVGCGATAAEAATWGSIKSNYR